MFMLPLLVALLLATPGQPTRVLGIEFIILGTVHGLALTLARRRKQNAGNEEKLRVVRLLDYTSPNTVTTLIVLAAGAIFVSGHVAGVYLLVPAVILALIGGVANAWMLLIDGLN